MPMEVELEFEEDATCPHCKKNHIVKGVARGDIEPPEQDGPER